jgi:hypothetical protein
MRRSHTLDLALWERDVIVLPERQQPIARAILEYVRTKLNGNAYHRSTKFRSYYDRQTIVKHAGTGFICLVISVVPDPEDDALYALRLDFFDKEKKIQTELGEITEAPGTQWPLKGERRFIVPKKATMKAVKPILDEIWAIAAVRTA